VPRTSIVFYQEAGGVAPVCEWLAHLRRTTPRAYAKCVVRLERLRELGHELRRPEADVLREGIHELRIRLGRVNYRLLYAFHRRVIAVLLHAVIKEESILETDIDLAVARKRTFEQDPDAHALIEPVK